MRMEAGKLTKGAPDKTAKKDAAEAMTEDRDDKHENKGEKQARAHAGEHGHKDPQAQPGQIKMDKEDRHLKGSKHFGGKSEY